MTYLESIEQAIADFESAAFNGDSQTKIAARKKAMKFAKVSCPYDNVQGILGSSIDYLAKRPEEVRAAIRKARDALETLRTCRPDLE